MPSLRVFRGARVASAFRYQQSDGPVVRLLGQGVAELAVEGEADGGALECGEEAVETAGTMADAVALAGEGEAGYEAKGVVWRRFDAAVLGLRFEDAVAAGGQFGERLEAGPVHYSVGLDEGDEECFFGVEGGLEDAVRAGFVVFRGDVGEEGGGLPEGLQGVKAAGDGLAFRFDRLGGQGAALGERRRAQLGFFHGDMLTNEAAGIKVLGERLLEKRPGRAGVHPSRRGSGQKVPDAGKNFIHGVSQRRPKCCISPSMLGENRPPRPWHRLCFAIGGQVRFPAGPDFVSGWPCATGCFPIDILVRRWRLRGPSLKVTPWPRFGRGDVYIRVVRGGAGA